MIPRTIPVLGRDYLIRRKRMKDYGLCDFGSGTIWLRSGLKGMEAEQTLLHEVIHATLHESGIQFQWTENSTECVVRALEHGLWRAGFRLES